MSTILGSTFSSTQADTTFSTQQTVDPRPPDGFGIQCKGLSTEGNNPDTVGVIFQVTVPSGFTLSQAAGRTGSWSDPKYGSGFDEWLLGIDNDGGRGGASTIEIWFSQEDVDGDNWTLPFKMTLKSGSGSTTYTYVFTKGGSGGGHGDKK